MSDTGNPAAGVPPNNPPPPPPAAIPSHPFPVVRLLYSIGYGFIAWLVIHIIFLLAVIQFVAYAINGRPSEELKSFCATLIQYELQLFAYITFVSDAQPFPVGPLPSHA